MLIVAAPPAAGMHVVVKCSAYTREGGTKRCDRVIAILNVEAFIGPQRVKCKCGHWEVFE